MRPNNHFPHLLTHLTSSSFRRSPSVSKKINPSFENLTREWHTDESALRYACLGALIFFPSSRTSRLDGFTNVHSEFLPSPSFSFPLFSTTSLYFLPLFSHDHTHQHHHYRLSDHRSSLFPLYQTSHDQRCDCVRHACQ